MPPDNEHSSSRQDQPSKTPSTTVWLRFEQTTWLHHREFNQLHQPVLYYLLRRCFRLALEQAKSPRLKMYRTHLCTPDLRMLSIHKNPLKWQLLGAKYPKRSSVGDNKLISHRWTDKRSAPSPPGADDDASCGHNRNRVVLPDDRQRHSADKTIKSMSCQKSRAAWSTRCRQRFKRWASKRCIGTQIDMTTATTSATLPTLSTTIPRQHQPRPIWAEFIWHLRFQWDQLRFDDCIMPNFDHALAQCWPPSCHSEVMFNITT